MSRNGIAKNGNGQQPATIPWEKYLAARQDAERIALMPNELQVALSRLISALCDMTEATFSPLRASSDIGVKVQSSGTGSSGMDIANRDFAHQLRKTLPSRIDRVATHVREALVFEENNGHAPRRGPRFR